LGAVPNALCGELTELLAPDYAWIPKDCAPAEVFEPGYPDTCCSAEVSIWNGIPTTGPIQIHQFTYVADYQDPSEAAAMAGRLYGPKAKDYFLARSQSSFAWRLQIIMGQVRK